MPLHVTCFFFAIPDYVAIVVVVVGIPPAVVGVLPAVVAVAVVDGSFACRAWCIVLCLPTAQYSIPTLLKFHLALFCAGSPLMRWVGDARCLSSHVDHGAA